MAADPAFIKITHEQIISEPGELPPRPVGLVPNSDDEMSVTLILDGKSALVVGGVSLCLHGSGESR